jgi:hypothetical protein
LPKRGGADSRNGVAKTTPGTSSVTIPCVTPDSLE